MKGILQETLFLIQKEIRLELRQKYAISGILLYVISTIFVIYLSFITVEPRIWNALFWIVVLFASVNAVTKSFIQENSNRALYYYTLINPTSLILSKIIYNTLLLFILTLLSFIVFTIIVDDPIKDYSWFFLVLFLGSLGFSIAFTFISAIAAKASNSATLMAILGFPVIIPIIMILLKLSGYALGLVVDLEIWRDVVMLLAIDTILIAIVLILFPSLWRD